MADSIAFLMGDIGRLMRRRFDERARTIGVTRPQWRTLSMLNRFEGSNQGALAELLEVEPITLCRMIDRLEDAGLVERQRDPDDRRAWQLYLTPKARPLIEKLRALGDALYEEAAAGIAEADRHHLLVTLETVRANLSTRLPEPETKHG